MQIYRDSDADLSVLAGKKVAVIGYGNQGRAQALNLRDSGVQILIGNRADAYAEQAHRDGFSVAEIDEATAQTSILMLLIPDEVMPEVFEAKIAPNLRPGNTLVFASGYGLAFGEINPARDLDIILLAPRMIGAGVRDLYLAQRGFPAFIAVENDSTGNARATVLALAKAIGSTRVGVVEVTFRQEAELDLFSEQCFGPAFGQVLLNAVNLLIEQGYPPEAVLLELYMSGEFAYTLSKIAELGMVEQTRLHSRTSQYGSLSRGMRFMLPELRERMTQGLAEIRSGEFAREWAAEQAAGTPSLQSLQEMARTLPLYQWEQELRLSLGGTAPVPLAELPVNNSSMESPASRAGLAQARKPGWLDRLRRSNPKPAAAGLPALPLDKHTMANLLERFGSLAMTDPALQEFARRNQITSEYELNDLGISFYLSFDQGEVRAGLDSPPAPPQVQLVLDGETLDGLFSGRLDAARAALGGKIAFKGDTRLALSMQRLQPEFRRLYLTARSAVQTG